VQVSSPDGNPLTYSWSVNGQVVSNGPAPNYSLQLPASASGIYNVTVVVTDGARVTQASWAINAAAYHQPSILFDDSHDEQDSIDPARASQLNPTTPSVALFGTLDQALQTGYQVSRLTSGPITPQVLSGTDVLVLAAPSQALTAAENQAISSFVQAGGGLIFLGVRGLNSSINTLIAPWGNRDGPTVIVTVSASSVGSDMAVMKLLMEQGWKLARPIRSAERELLL
jgi:hypothetical protein